jgi:large repetitive protein
MSRFLRLVAVVAVVFSSFPLEVAAPVGAANSPAVPETPTVGRTTATTIALTWNAPADNGGSAITKYEVFRNGVRVASIPSRTYTIGGLSGGVTYSITINACNLLGCSDASVPVDVLTKPAAATLLRVAPSDGAVTATWTDSLTTSVTEHHLWYRPTTTSTLTEWTPGVPDTSGTTITGLINGKTYSVVVRSSAANGFTDTPGVLATPMAPPPGVTLSYSNISQNGLILNWAAPVVPTALPTTYELYRDGVKFATTTGKYSPAAGLTPLQQYSFTAKACNVAGCSELSAPLVVTLPPPPPSRVVASAAPNKMVVSWMNSPVADFHSVWYKLTSASTWTEWTPGQDDFSPLDITSIAGGVAYNIRVGSHGTNGQASFSPVVTVIPLGAPSAPLGVKQTLSSDTTATVTWTAPFDGGTAITGYKVFVDGVLKTEPSRSTTTVLLDGLTRGSSYLVTVQACNIVGCSFSSPDIRVFTNPAAVSDVVVTPLPTTAAVSWSSSSTAVSGYKIFFRKDGATQWVELTPTVDDSSGTSITNLSAATDYETYVRAYNPRGFADSSVVQFSTTSFFAPTAPLAVSATATPAGARLTWNAPTSNGHAVISDYVIEFSSNGGGSWSILPRTASSATNASITGLTTGRSHIFRVSAKNVAGTSIPSEASAAVVPYALATAPRNVSATSGNALSTITWDEPLNNGGIAVSDYVVQYSNNNGTAWSTFADGVSAATTATVPGLTNGTRYVFRVAAVNDAGLGAYSAASAAVTPLTAPGVPTKVLGTPAAGQVKLSWTVPGSNGGSVFADYLIQTSADNGVTWIDFDDGISAATTSTVTGLTNGSGYVFRVAAVNSLTSGDYSVASAVVTPRTTPGAPTEMTASPGNLSASVSWTPPVFTGGAEITDYLIQFSSNNGSTWRTFADGISNVPTATITGLLNGTNYLFKVSAVTGAGAGTASDPSDPIAPRTLPGVPTYLTPVVGDGTAPLSWRAPTSNGGAAITDYEVQYSVNNGTDWITFADGTSSTPSTTVTGLTNGSTYVFRVRALNAAGLSPYTVATAPLLLRTFPDAPSALTVTPAPSSLMLSWSIPGDNGGSPISDYAIQYSSNAGLVWTTYAHTASTTPSITVAGLTNGTGYLVRVAAVTSFGTGGYVTTTSTVAPRTTPSAPTNLVTTYGDTAVALTWVAPSSNGGATIATYVVQYSTNNGSSWTTFDRAPSTVTSVNVTGLTNGTNYVFRVAAANIAGTGTYTAASAPVTPRTFATAPLNVTSTYGNTSVALSWDAPENDGGVAITDYTIQHSSNSGTNWTTFVDSVSSATTATVTGLTNGTNYIFRVAAVNNVGTGAYSENSPPATPRTTPGVPAAVSTTFGNTSVSVSWTAPASNGGASISDYTVQYSSNAGGTWTSFAHTASAATIISVTGLTNGTSYVFRVAAVNNVGAGSFTSATAAVIPRTTPDAPTGLTGTFADSSVALSWTAPDSNGGAAISDYTVQYSTNAGSSWATFTRTASTATTATVTGLTNGATYIFRVAAVNNVGRGAYSTSTDPVTPRTAPAAPTAVAGTFGNTEVALTWTAPNSDGGAVISDYVIQYSSNAGSSWTTFSDGTSTDTSVTVTGLTNGTSYVFRVAATNDVGNGTYSSSSSTVIPRTIPDAPTSLSAAYGNAQATLSWTAPASNGGATVTNYTIQFSSDAGDSWSTFSRTASSSTSATVTGLTNGTSYVFRVAAVNNVGSSAFSNTSSAVTPRTTPTAPTSLTAVLGNGQADLTWTAPTSDGGAVITDYVIQYSANSGTSWTTFSDGTSISTSETVTGLTNGTSYIFRVAASNSEGNSSYSATSNPVIPRTVPTVVRSTSSTPADQSVILNWIAPASNGGNAITDYVVEFSSDAGATWDTFSDGVGTSLTATVTGLTNGVEYSFRISAANEAGEGPTAAAPSATPRTTATAPLNVAGTPGYASVALTWDAPADDGGAAISDYVIQYSSNSGSTWTTYSDGTSTATSATLSGLTKSVGHVFRVAATNVAGQSAYSTTSATITPAATLDAPSSLNATYGNTQVTLAWTAPTVPSGAAVLDYEIQYSSDGGSSWNTFNHVASAAVTRTVTGLTNGTSYVFRVATVNDAGAGSFTANTAAVIPRTTPGTPTSLATTYGDAQVELSWNAPASNGGAAISDYTIQYSSNSGFSWTSFSHTASSSTGITVTGLTNGTSYVFRVAAVNNVGAGSYTAATAAVTPRRVSDAPTNVAGTYGDTEIALTWTAPASNGGAAISDYVVELSTNGGSSWTTFTDGVGTSTSTTVTGLTNGTSYVFHVAAVNSEGTSAFSATSAAVVPRTTPDQPTATSGTYGDTEVALVWEAPASDGGASISDYVIQYSSNSGSTWTTFSHSPTVSTSITVTGLTNGTSYVFRVAAVNSVGTGAYSSNSSAVIPRTTPGAPTSVAGTYGDTQVSLTWTAPSSNGGDSVSDYRIQYSSNSGTTWTTFADGTSTATSETVTGLTNGTSYIFRIAAANNVGFGSYSSNSTAVIPRRVPDAPTAVIGTAGDTQVSLSWTTPASNGGAAISDYVIQYSSNSGSTWTTFADGTSTAVSATVTGLTNGTTYIFRVAATNNVGNSAYSSNSASIKVQTNPGAPTSVAGTRGSTQVILTWSPPSYDSGTAITDYAVQYSSNSGSTWTTFPHAASTATSITVNGLANGTSYIFRVAAVNAVGTGTYSTASSAVTPATTPGAPSITQATGTTTSVTLTFSAPASNGGSAITSYAASCTSSNGGTARVANGTGSPLTVASLDAGYAYSCGVLAANVVGAGSYSTAKTLAAAWVNTSYYSCPSGGSLSGSTCYVPDSGWVNTTQPASVVWTCSVGGSSQQVSNKADRPYSGVTYYGSNPHDTAFGSGHCAGYWTTRNYYSANGTCYRLNSSSSVSSGCPTGTYQYRRRDTHVRSATETWFYSCGFEYNLSGSTCYHWLYGAGYWSSPAYSYAATYNSTGYWNGWTIT